MSDLRTAAQQALEALYEETAWFGPTPKGAAAITALRAALAEPVQEPVAWLVTDCIGERDLCFSPPLDNDQVLPLYAAPPQRKPPIADEALWEMWVDSPSDVLAFARRIEMWHGITGGSDE